MFWLSMPFTLCHPRPHSYEPFWGRLAAVSTVETAAVSTVIT